MINWFLIFSIGIFLVLLLWDRVSIFLLKERVSVLEKEIGIKDKECNDESK